MLAIKNNSITITITRKNDRYKAVIQPRKSDLKIKVVNSDILYSCLQRIKDKAVIKATFCQKDVLLSFDGGDKLILKNYQKYSKFIIYKNYLNKITPITKINNIQNVNLNRLKKIATISLLSIGIVSTIVGIKNSKSVDANNLYNYTIEDNLIEKPISSFLPGVMTNLVVIPTLTSTPIPTPTSTSIPTSTSTPIPTPTSTPIPTPTSIPIELINDFDYRLAESIELNKNADNGLIPLATKVDNYFIKSVTNAKMSEEWKYIQKYANEFGIDPYLLLAMSYEESSFDHNATIPGGVNYNGYGVGLFQIEKPNENHIVTAFNYETNTNETTIANMNNACSLETNVKLGAMLFQNRLNKYNNNLYVTIQSYNYGEKAMNTILDSYSKEKNCTIDEILNEDINIDIGWLKYVDDYHFNPNDYIEWSFPTYGNNEYIKEVLGFYIGTLSINKNELGDNIITDLATMTISKNKIH